MIDTPDDFDAWLDAGTVVESEISVCLAGDLHEQYVVALTEIAKLADDPSLSMDDNRLSAARDRAEELREEMQRHTRTIKVRAMDPLGYYRLVVEHPPREGDEVDKAQGVNYDTFTVALVEASTDLTTAQVAKLRQKVSFRQWSEIWQTARNLSTDEVSVPKSLPVFDTTQSSVDGPKQRKGSGSRSRGSRAGSQRPPTPTTTPDV